MSDFMMEMALRHFGFDDTQIARITADIPKAAYLATLVKNNKTVINEMIDVIEMVLSQVAKSQQGT